MAERRFLRAAAAGAGDRVWAYDFVEDRTRDGRKLRMLNVEPRGSPDVVDEFTRECLAIRVRPQEEGSSRLARDAGQTEVGRRLGSAEVPDARASSRIDVLADLFTARGTPGHIRSDNGGEFVATGVKGWITGVGAKTAFIEPGSPWENGYVE